MGNQSSSEEDSSSWGNVRPMQSSETSETTATQSPELTKSATTLVDDFIQSQEMSESQQAIAEDSEADATICLNDSLVHESSDSQHLLLCDSANKQLVNLSAAAVVLMPKSDAAVANGAEIDKVIHADVGQNERKLLQPGGCDLSNVDLVGFESVMDLSWNDNEAMHYDGDRFRSINNPEIIDVDQNILRLSGGDSVHIDRIVTEQQISALKIELNTLGSRLYELEAAGRTRDKCEFWFACIMASYFAIKIITEISRRN